MRSFGGNALFFQFCLEGFGFGLLLVLFFRRSRGARGRLPRVHFALATCMEDSLRERGFQGLGLFLKLRSFIAESFFLGGAAGGVVSAAGEIVLILGFRCGDRLRRSALSTGRRRLSSLQSRRLLVSGDLE